jgi:large subunit ribosomal protein L35Ae
MKGQITSFRMSRTRQSDNQMIVNVEGIDTKVKAEKLVGKKVVYKTEAEREIAGKVSASHGNKGAVRVIFEKGMPGQSLFKPVEIF